MKLIKKIWFKFNHFINYKMGWFFSPECKQGKEEINKKWNNEGNN